MMKFLKRTQSDGSCCFLPWPATTICRSVFNMNKPGALRRVIMGEPEGTLIHQASK